MLTDSIDGTELERLPPGVPRTTVSGESQVERELEPRRAELDRLSPATPDNPVSVELDADLTGAEQRVVALDLQRAVLSAVNESLPVRIARVQPAINREDLVNAQAAFDTVLVANASYVDTDQPQTVPVLNGIPLGTPFSASRNTRFDTGLRKPLRWGGEARVTAAIDRNDNRSPGIALDPDPAYSGNLRLGITQPLLRGFGEPVNTATIRLAQNQIARADAQLVLSLLDVVEAAELAYWDLGVAWNELEVRQWLVNVGQGVRDQIAARAEYDVKPAEKSDAQARIESRKADVIRARRSVIAASDRLKSIINDPEISIESEVVLRPADPFPTQPLTFNLREAVLIALQNRPEVRESRLSIDDARITERAAENLTLPLLNLTGEIAWFGLDDSAGDAIDATLDDDFIEYVVGLAFEYPLGNRAAEAEARAARLARSQTALAYRQTVQNVILEVKAALRDVVTNFDLIRATRSFRVAQAENLRALEAELPLRGLTPTFLDFKFQRQDGLALARIEEHQALASFEQSLAALYRAMGVGLERRQVVIEVVAPEAGMYAPLPDGVLEDG